jgi:predicted GNAT family N-acyltransferase
MLKLRERELRIPIGLSLTECDLEAEDLQHHFGMFNTDQQLCACVVLSVERYNGHIQLRQMVVEPKYRGNGVGRLLYEKVETWCVELGACQIYLNARVTAKDFYRKLGFSECGVEFNHITLPHIEMIKVL